MAEFINYTWQSTFCLTFLFGLYWVFLRNEKVFRFNRFFLLAAPILALFFPLIEVPVNFDKPSISLENTAFLKSLQLEQLEEPIGIYGLPAVTVTDTKLPLIWEWKDYLLLGYALVILFLSSKLIWQLFQLRELKHRGWYQAVYKLKGSYYFIPTFGLAPVFSYFDKLFWDDTQTLTAEEERQIIQHELEHIRQRHSYDVLYYQVLCIVFWFNPVIHLMRMALVDLHEYMADAKVLDKVENKTSYHQLIVKLAFKGLDLPIGNYFIRSTTLKRIIMMKKPAKINWYKMGMVIPLTAMLFGLVAMKSDRGLSFWQQNNQAKISPEQARSIQDSLDVGMKVRQIEDPQHYEKVGIWQDGTLRAQVGNLEYEFAGIQTEQDYWKVRELIKIIGKNASIQKSYSRAHSSYAVDERPSPKEGFEQWKSYLLSEIHLPKKENEIGLSGTMELEFVVNEKGQIHSPSIKRSFGGGVDEQVLRALSSSNAPLWTPGTKAGEVVATIVTQPITISFGEKESQPEPFFSSPREAYPTPLGYGMAKLASDDVFEVVEQMPIPNGSMEGWRQYIDENLSYTESARRNRTQGTVYVGFVINKDGSTRDAQILRGIGDGLDEEALRLVENSPPWQPGIQQGVNVNTRMRVPIRFSLEPEEEKSHSFQNDIKDKKVVPTEDFKKHLLSQLKFPIEARDEEKTGVVLVELAFNEKGDIKSYRIKNGLHEEIDKNLEEVLQNAPSWEVKEQQQSYKGTFAISYNLNGTQHPKDGLEMRFGVAYSVHGYGNTFRKLGPKENGVLKVEILNEEKISFNGKRMDLDDKLSKAIASLLEKHELDPTSLTIHLSAPAKTKMGTVAKVNEAMRNNDIRRLLYTSTEGEPLNFNPSAEEGNYFASSNEKPLIVWDGKVVSSMDNISPEEIENISVLKGTRATNVFGEDGKHGVIIINSKK
ncbi:TonB family protein [Pleomorphovibrio marinus]|uniref:TonB family protein n=1 Tax=Pleomorphovibrio marinus TaxID=2164132 RepID=UPI000E0AC9C4|nr:TonB family protein [Pleomorphovibrio marinus]